MQRFFKTLVMLVALVAGAQVSFGFALIGPFEGYQAASLGYQAPYLEYLLPGGPTALQDMGGPHEINEEFRRSVPELYYSFDEVFWNFFGSNGVAAVDQAFSIMNSLTNVSLYSPELFEFPQQAQRINYQAQNLALTDLKSTTLHLIVEQMGLAQPERYSWVLHDRNPGNACPTTAGYVVVPRNYGLLPSALNQYSTSSYINGTLYSYGIVENCTGNVLAYTIPYAVDPNAETYTAVAADAAPQQTISQGSVLGFNTGGVGLHIGGFYTYLTRDDVGGIRHLLSKENINLETAGANTVQYLTNNTPVLLTNLFDLGLFAAQAATNDAAALQALYPGLLVNDTTNWISLGFNTNISLVTTSSPFWPAGTVAVIAVTNLEPVAIFHYGHTFGNIITNSFSKRSTYRTQTVTPTGGAFGVAGSSATLTTNAPSRPITANSISGSFFILPANLCAIKVIASLYTNVVATTNLIASVPLASDTNQLSTFSIISYFTNNWLVYLPVTCPANTVAYRQGIERVSFVRRDFDSLIGTFWAPQTNDYTMVELTNSTLRPQHIQRVVTQPDFLFTAQDLVVGPNGNNFVGTVNRNNLRFNQVSSNGVAGPGTIETPTTFIFNKVGPVYWNQYDAALFNSSPFASDQSSAVQSVAWASYGGDTNDPVIYPNGTSFGSYLSQLVIRVQPQVLPAGKKGVPYTFAYTNSVSGNVYTNQLSVTGGQGPFSWSLAPGSGGLPTGLSLSVDGHVFGTPSGISRTTTFDFTIRATDANARSVDVPLAIKVVP